jgi:hypothetical protein
MDPYLEAPWLWPDVHHGIISITQEMLARLLRPKYYVRVEERVYISDETDPGRKVIVPDVRVAERPSWEGRAVALPNAGGVAIAAPLEVTTLIDDEIHEARLEVIDRERRDVVTVIEVLSPTNKVAGSRGRASYLEKRQEVTESPSNLVEIDFLRGGEPIHVREDLPPHDYLVHASVRGRRPRGWVWPIRLQETLPVVAVPLRPDDPLAPLDLQAVLTTAYDRAGYDLSINYRDAPTPPLRGEAAGWADQLLREKGLR